MSYRSRSRKHGRSGPGRQSGAAQRSVILGVAVGAVAVVGIWLIVGRSAEPPEQAHVETVEETTLAEPAEPALPLPAPDATITLASGQQSAPLVAASFAPDAILKVDLALPVSIEQSDPLWARVVTADREPLMLDGLVRGADRNTVRIEVPASWLAPGQYLVEIKTPERSHLPLRRFAFVVE